MATTAALMTTEEFLALPEDGIHRELIEGELREYPMTTRNFGHSRATCELGHLLLSWSRARSGPRGAVVSGEARVRLRRDPDTIVGVDVAYISPELTAATEPNAFAVDGPPVLAVEILSPSNTHEEIYEKVQLYLSSGVPAVWVADPFFRTVTVHRPGAPPLTFNETQELVGDPELPGFRVPVAAIFGA